MFWCFVFVVIQAVADVAQPFFISEILRVDLTATTNEIMHHILLYGGIIFALSFVSFFFGIGVVLVSAKLGISIASKMRMRLFTKIQYLSSLEINHLGTGSLINRISNDITFLQQVSVISMRLIMRSTLLFLGGFISAFVYAQQLEGKNGTSLWWLGFVVLGFLALLFLGIGLVVFFSIPLNRRRQQELDSVNTLVRENLLGIKTVKMFNLQKKQTNLFTKINAKFTKIAIKAQNTSFIILPLMQFMTQAITVVLLLIIGLEIQTNVNFGIVPAFIQMIAIVGLGIFLSLLVFVNIAQILTSLRRIETVLQTQRKITLTNSTNHIKNGNVVFENVSFKYSFNHKSPNVIEQLSFQIKQGQTLGVIGPTGSGKSTLLQLLTRIHEPLNGQIYISDHKLQDIDYQSLRQNIGVVTQKSLLFAGTIRSNLLFGAPNASEEKMLAALKAAQAYDFVMQTVNKLDTVVEQRGNNFSGGQKQRLALARALIKEPKILVLDDCTSALDFITEKKVLDNLKNYQHTTVFLIAERIHTIQHADLILVLNYGKVAGIGQHAELLQKCNLYQEIAKSQNIVLN